MKLMTTEIRKTLPALGAQDGKGLEAIVYVKYFTPDAGWTWYATEYDPRTRTFFGLVDGMEVEFGYFELRELEGAHGPFGLKIERDLYFKPRHLRTLPCVEKEYCTQNGGDCATCSLRKYNQDCQGRPIFASTEAVHEGVGK